MNSFGFGSFSLRKLESLQNTFLSHFLSSKTEGTSSAENEPQSDGGSDAQVGLYGSKGGEMAVISRAIYRWMVRNRSTITSSVSGFLKGFLLYSFAMALIRKGKIDFNVVRRGAALGSFAATTRIFDLLLKESSVDLKSNNKMRRAICGGLGTLSAILIDNSFVNSILVMWTMLRAIYSIFPTSLMPNHSSTMVMCVSANQILTSWYTSSEDLNDRYRKMMDHQGGKPIKECMAHFRKGGVVNSCAIAHPGIGCFHHFFKFFSEGMVRAGRLYLPLYVVIFLVSKKKSVPETIVNAVRSSAFLSLYCTLAWASVCLANRLFPNATHTKTTFYSHFWIAGLSTLLERPSRQTELALYCATYALDSLYSRLGTLKILKKRDPILGAALLISSVSLLLYKSKLPAVLVKWLLDMDTTEKETEDDQKLKSIEKVAKEEESDQNGDDDTDNDDDDEDEDEDEDEDDSKEQGDGSQ